jgi:hypothetical protein
MRIEIVVGGVGGSTLLGHSGTATIASGASSKAITFAAAFADTTYSLTFAIVNVTDASPIMLWGVITAKSTTGATVTFNTATDTANYEIDYQAIQAI